LMKEDPKILTKKERDCLLAIYHDLESSGLPPRLTDLARAMGVRPPTALELIRRLMEKGVVERRRGLIALSESGRREALNILAVHRALEVFFAGCGMSADEACSLAGQIDYIVESRLPPGNLLEALGNPTQCPHGYPIPGGSARR